MNSQASLTDQLVELVALANKNGLYDAADWLNNMLRRRYFKHKTLGVTSVVPAHQDGDFTFLPGFRESWIRTADLHTTQVAAERAPVAQFLE